MSTCYIVGAGDFPRAFEPEEDDLVIAADGGYDALISHGIRCDLLIGDCDSLDRVPLGVELIRFPVEKDDTDSFLAYKEGVRRGYSHFEIFGGTGGRDDHTFSNLSLLLYAKESGHTARLVGWCNTSFVIMNEAVTLKGEAGKHVSVFALGGNAEGVTIEGLYYTADDITLTPSFPLAASNLFKGEEAKISVRRGALLIMTEN